MRKNTRTTSQPAWRWCRARWRRAGWTPRRSSRPSCAPIGTPDALAACDILGIILRDEIGHVAIGNRWYRWLCERQGLEPVAHYRVLARQYGAPRLKGPFNTDARRQAGFVDTELSALNEPGAP